MQNPREITQRIESDTLSKYATLSANSKGREREEEQDPIRTDFQRDRDRIIHCKSFRRLKHKTQVFLSPESDHYRTRLTHTLEVAQIARTISRALRLNEDLTEAIALGHDLGHTPFGHAGERSIRDIIYPEFTHFEQSVRVCKVLEKNLNGLNLTSEVLDGILHHTRGEQSSNLEGRVVRISDRIAYINHDIGDAIRGGIIKEVDIPKKIREYLGGSKSKRISTLVSAVINNSESDILLDEETQHYFDELHDYLFENVYFNPKAKSEEDKVNGIIEGLYKYYKKNPDELKGEFAIIRERDGLDRAITDYIAGMTDHFAIMTYSNIHIPKSWSY
ncbi:MAG: deoxyguanosinetriphosphate triphosphohydrolase [Clostridia bacterium]|nr:deoxyguanosinetriphosphate triphosphohydrolase [Clostridia bacterium]